MKTLDEIGGIEAFDQMLAQVLERLRKLSATPSLPKAFVLALPTTNGVENGAAVELIVCCPTDLDTIKKFVGMTLSCIEDWAGDALEEIQEREEEEDE